MYFLWLIFNTFASEVPTKDLSCILCLRMFIMMRNVHWMYLLLPHDWCSSQVIAHYCVRFMTLPSSTFMWIYLDHFVRYSNKLFCQHMNIYQDKWCTMCFIWRFSRPRQTIMALNLADIVVFLIYIIDINILDLDVCFSKVWILCIINKCISF